MTVLGRRLVVLVTVPHLLEVRSVVMIVVVVVGGVVVRDELDGVVVVIRVGGITVPLAEIATLMRREQRRHMHARGRCAGERTEHGRKTQEGECTPWTPHRQMMPPLVQRGQRHSRKPASTSLASAAQDARIVAGSSSPSAARAASIEPTASGRLKKTSRCSTASIATSVDRGSLVRR